MKVIGKYILLITFLLLAFSGVAYYSFEVGFETGALIGFEYAKLQCEVENMSQVCAM